MFGYTEIHLNYEMITKLNVIFIFKPIFQQFTQFYEFLGIKEFSNWPTIPQVYINGEFVGGCDIMIQMHQSGDLIEELKKAGINSALLDKQETSSNETKK